MEREREEEAGHQEKTARMCSGMLGGTHRRGWERESFLKGKVIVAALAVYRDLAPSRHLWDCQDNLRASN